MNQLLVDAAIVGGKEALKLALVWYACSAFFLAHGRGHLMRSFYAGVVIASGLFVLSFFLPHDMAARQLIARFTGYVFFLFFMAAIALMFNRNILTFKLPRPLEPIIVVFVTVLFFSSDIIGSSLYLREVAVLSEQQASVYFSASGAFVLGVGILFNLLKDRRGDISDYLGLAEIMIFLSLVKFLGSGSQGFAEISLVGSVQEGLIKFTHDAVHQSLLYLMVPDHPLLVTTTWNFIGFFFGDTFTSFLALIILTGPMLAYLYFFNTAEIPEQKNIESAAHRRMHRARVMSLRRRRSLMAFVFAISIFVSWYTIGGRSGAASLDTPKPRPVIAEEGVVSIPIKSPSHNLMDGKIHKFSVALENETVNLLVIRKPNGALSVSLDACEICPPDGYGKSEGHVVCLYCKTPIPLEALGKPGGCNPIPLEVRVTDTEVLIALGEMAEKWRFVTSGQSREGIR
jgi:hypothetical protein